MLDASLVKKKAFRFLATSASSILAHLRASGKKCSLLSLALFHR